MKEAGMNDLGHSLNVLEHWSDPAKSGPWSSSEPLPDDTSRITNAEADDTLEDLCRKVVLSVDSFDI